MIRIYSCLFVVKLCRMPNEPNPVSDRVHIEQLELSARIGVPEKERATPQRLTVSISFWPYYKQRDMADHIDNTVNYSIVAEETKNFVRDTRRPAGSALAENFPHPEDHGGAAKISFGRCQARLGNRNANRVRRLKVNHYPNP